MNLVNLEIGTDGFLHDVLVIGFYGGSNGSSTPARKGPVYIHDGRILNFLPGRKREKGKVICALGRSIKEFEKDGPFWVRVEPRPARYGYFFVLVGADELRYRQEIARHCPNDCPKEVVKFFEWLADPKRLSSRELVCEWLDAAPDFVSAGVAPQEGVCAWYCSPAQADAVFNPIRDAAYEKMKAAYVAKDSSLLKHVSWWHARAAMSNKDVYLAICGLMAAGEDDYTVRILKESIYTADGKPMPEEQAARELEEARLFFLNECGRGR